MKIPSENKIKTNSATGKFVFPVAELFVPVCLIPFLPLSA